MGKAFPLPNAGSEADEASTRLSIAILALGGQGGGVLADWIADLGRGAGWIAQTTSVPGVAQRTGSTVYYVELARRAAGREPIMAQMPMPGDVDVALASELMEAGRAVLRGFSTTGRTTLIGSTHRIYAIDEKMVRGEGSRSGERIIAACHANSADFIGFDMQAASERADSVISSVMFGALAGSDRLPFDPEQFENTIRRSGIAIEANLRGFEEGFAAAQVGGESPREPQVEVPIPTSPLGRELAASVRALPFAAHEFAMIALARLIDYQDGKYAALYLDRLRDVAALDAEPFELTRELARHLALWMAYEDTIRVADLKIRSGRFQRVRKDVQANDREVVELVEFMHPRLQEVCETMPERVGRFVFSSKLLTRLLGPLFRRGRQIRTSSISGFVTLFLLSRLRPVRRWTWRYAVEQQRIVTWITRVKAAAARGNHDLAVEIVRCQRLIKGYGETFERGLQDFARMMELADNNSGAPGLSDHVREEREAALAQSC